MKTVNLHRWLAKIPLQETVGSTALLSGARCLDCGIRSSKALSHETLVVGSLSTGSPAGHPHAELHWLSTPTSSNCHDTSAA